ncbi:MAG: SPOR domain-containing protein [Methylomonas sp.]
MADSIKKIGKKTPDSLEDDLDVMMNMDDTPAAHQVGEIDDDDAIDRLLMGDNFQHVEAGTERDEFADLDELIGDEVQDDRKVASEIDEFGDDIDEMIANIRIDKHQAEPVVDDFDEFAEEDAQLVKSIDEVMTPELVALEKVAEVDEFGDDTVPAVVAYDTKQEELEGMKEIDEFSDVSPVSSNRVDFLMADFDISSGDDKVEPVAEEQLIDEFEDHTVEMPVAEGVGAATAAFSDQTPSPVDEFAEAESAKGAPAAVAPEKTQSQPEHGAELAALSSQITVLKKHQQTFKQEMTEKAGKDELVKCLEDIASLQGEQKKTKRAVDAVANNKPIAAYVANGLAVIALLIGTGLGFQGYIAKSQVAELVPIIGKLQERFDAAPGAGAPGNEMLQQQLNELKAANSQASNQIAEINKALQGGTGGAKTGGDTDKLLAELSNQNMQMGAAIEALQSKVNALEKNRAAAAAPVAKPETKKPVVVENWAVNLIAFKQDWYAKRKAEEFAAKGVPAKVIKSETKGETWYRLFVDGFKSQYEAAGYAAKVKKTLNLDSVWVTRNKD